MHPTAETLLKARSSVILLAVLSASTAVAASSSSSHSCNNAGLTAAADARSVCRSSAMGAFTDALYGCLPRDPGCIGACRFQLEDCRDSTGAGDALVACQVELKGAKDRCRSRFPLGSKKRATCIDRAQADAFRCRRGVLRNFRHALRDCRSAFSGCADACAPGGPAGGVDACKADAKAELQSDLATCKATFEVTASAAINKNAMCVQGCGDARDACNAPTNSTLLAATVACTMQEKAAAQACAQANPGGGAALEECLMTAQSNAFACRQAALNAAKPALTACTVQYLGCVKACPAA